MEQIRFAGASFASKQHVMLGVRRAQPQGREIASRSPSDGNIKTTKGRPSLDEVCPEIRHRFFEARLCSAMFDKRCHKYVQHILSGPLLRLVCE